MIDDLVTENAELQQQLTMQGYGCGDHQGRAAAGETITACTYKCVLVRGLPLGFSLSHNMSLSNVHSIEGFSLLHYSGATATADEEGS